jgi:hypothetical protein
VVRSFGRSEGWGSRRVVVVGERYWVSDVWAGVQNLVFAGKKSEGQVWACPVLLRCCYLFTVLVHTATGTARVRKRGGGGANRINRYYGILFLILVFYTLQVVLSIGTDIRM